MKLSAPPHPTLIHGLAAPTKDEALFEMAVKLFRSGARGAEVLQGRRLVVSVTAGEIPKIPLNLTLLKGCAIVGVFWGDFTRREPARFAEDMRQLGRWYAEGKLKPHISSRFPLERAADALTLMARRQVTGKVVITVG